jgi:hypothetical protein
MGAVRLITNMSELLPYSLHWKNKSNKTFDVLWGREVVGRERQYGWLTETLHVQGVLDMPVFILAAFCNGLHLARQSFTQPKLTSWKNMRPTTTIVRSSLEKFFPLLKEKSLNSEL